MPLDMFTDDESEFAISPRRVEPDAYGQAALLLVESLLHAIVENGILSVDQAIAVVRSASEIKVEVAEEIGESEGRMNGSLAVLAKIERSLQAGMDMAGNAG